MSSPETASFPHRHWVAALAVTVGVLLLQVPLAILGTELGWAGGVDVGIQTRKTGTIFGLFFASLLLLLVLTAGRRIFARRPRGSWIFLGISSVVLSMATVGFTMLRAAASFFLYLEP